MPNLGQLRQFLEPCDLEIWWMTLKNNSAPLLSNIKLYASFHHHMWIQTGVTVWKRLSWVVTSVTLTFDLWPWTFAWTLLWSLVIIPENFMMIQWWEHSQKGVTDRRKIPFVELLGRSLKSDDILGAVLCWWSSDHCYFSWGMCWTCQGVEGGIGIQGSSCKHD